MKSTKTILIAEDEKQTRETLMFVLRNAGYRVIQSLSGQETLSTVLERQSSEHPIDLLILDCDISGLTGWRVLHEIKQLDVPTVVITGLLNEGKIPGVEENNSLTCLKRPFEADDVLACVAKLLSFRNQDRENIEEAGAGLERPSKPSPGSELQVWNDLPVTFSARRNFMNLAALLHEDCIQANADVSDKRSVAGSNLHLSALPSLGLLGLLYILARTVGLIGGSRIGAMFGHVEEKIKKYVGLGILSQAGVAIGLSLIVKHEFSSLGRVVETVNGQAITSGAKLGAVVITTVTATCIFFEIIGPILTKIALTKAGEIPKSAQK